MSSYIEIAKRIAGIINSPELEVGIMMGVLSVPKDLAYMAYGFIDTESRSLRQSEKIRMANAIRYGILESENFRKSIEIIFCIFKRYLTDKEQDSATGDITGTFIGRMLTNLVLSSRLTNAIAVKNNALYRGGAVVLGNILLVGGMADRSIYTSQRLQRFNPEVWNALHLKDFDLLYFLIEPAVQPFVEALYVRRTQGPEAFEKIISLAEELINGKKSC
ncbi:hypothetical protein [Pantoea sp. A4]|uniref:hypothetical protein n=1 Tax=Pantoea sp. A4 TaxID=1225184 RepID=UPI000382A96D|nr:hypothetical protein [Pantoea sp. A4]